MGGREMINNENKHKGLDKKELRDFIGKTFHDECYWETSEQIMKKIEALKEQLKKTKIAEGLLEVMELLGWKSFDVNDHLHYFIGTKEEYEKLIGENK
jgi:hypothetical protein